MGWRVVFFWLWFLARARLEEGGGRKLDESQVPIPSAVVVGLVFADGPIFHAGHTDRQRCVAREEQRARYEVVKCKRGGGSESNMMRADTITGVRQGVETAGDASNHLSNTRDQGTHVDE